MKRQRDFLKKDFLPTIESFRNVADQSIDKEDFNKIENYYGFGVPSILGESYCALRNSPLKDKERWCMTYLAAMTGLFDDFFDKRNTRHEQIHRLINDGDAFRPETENERFCHFLWTSALKLSPDEKALIDQLNLVFQDQIESLEQLNPNLSKEEIRRITFNKGGHSIQFYRLACEHPLAKGEWEALFELGAVMQLGNDIFDIYKDSRDGIFTLVTTSESIKNISEEYSKQLFTTTTAFERMDYPPPVKKRIITKILLGMARVNVCLDQFSVLEKKSKGNFNPKDFERKALICDMEKPINFLKSIGYYLLKS